MKIPYIKFIRNLALGLICCFAIVGCASFPGKELPKYTYEQLPPREQKPSVDYDAKFFTLGMENPSVVKLFQDEIVKVFSGSNVFSRFAAGIGSEPYHLSLVLENKGNVGLAVLSGVISGLTLTIIPTKAKDEYVLTVDVKKGDKLLKQYQYTDHIDTWFQLFLIFLTPTHFPSNVAKEVIDNMLLNFLYDLQKDGILI